MTNDENAVQIHRWMKNGNQCFYLLAGAGSGKTYTLVEALKKFQEDGLKTLRLLNRQVAVITYTNAACDEIRARLGLDPGFAVSTIHSFCWNLIQPFREDIRETLIKILENEIENIEQSKSRDKNAKKVQFRTRLEEVKRFKTISYSPKGDDSEKGSLHHDEVLKITARFFEMPLFQQIVLQKYPILLIDECQDTNKGLLEALLSFESAHTGHFVLGLFGDPMQMIYWDGKKNLAESLPNTWEKLSNTSNFRSPRRIVDLINQLRTSDQYQQKCEQSLEGFAHLFLAPCGPDGKASPKYEDMAAS